MSDQSPKKTGQNQMKKQGKPMNAGLMGEYEQELGRLREENNQIRFAKDLRERDFENVMFENA